MTTDTNDMPVFELRPDDDAALPTLASYHYYAKHFKFPQEHLDAIAELINDFYVWRGEKRRSDKGITRAKEAG